MYRNSMSNVRTNNISKRITVKIINKMKNIKKMNLIFGVL